MHNKEPTRNRKNVREGKGHRSMFTACHSSITVWWSTHGLKVITTNDPQQSWLHVQMLFSVELKKYIFLILGLVQMNLSKRNKTTKSYIPNYQTLVKNRMHG